MVACNRVSLSAPQVSNPIATALHPARGIGRRAPITVKNTVLLTADSAAETAPGRAHRVYNAAYPRAHPVELLRFLSPEQPPPYYYEPPTCGRDGRI
jgi:hypothetical protein